MSLNSQTIRVSLLGIHQQLKIKNSFFVLFYSHSWERGHFVPHA